MSSAEMVPKVHSGPVLCANIVQYADTVYVSHITVSVWPCSDCGHLARTYAALCTLAATRSRWKSKFSFCLWRRMSVILKTSSPADP